MAKYTAEELALRKSRRRKKKIARLAVMGVCVCAMAFGMVKLVEGIIVPGEKIETSRSVEQILIQQPNIDLVKQVTQWEGYTGEVAQTINLENTIPEIDMVQVPESDPVDISYFDDAIFLGDSLADGFKVYTRTGSLTLKDSTAVYLTQKSTSPRTFLQPGVRIDAGDGLVDVWAVIEQRQPGKMYITLGINALMGMSPEDFIASYEQLIDKIRRTSPNTIIYVTTITPTTYRTSIQKPQLSFDRIYSANKLIAQMCRNKGLGLINLYDVLKDDSGYLRSEIARADGYHLTPTGYQQWLDYLTTHTMYAPWNPYLTSITAEEVPTV
ncbi:MAG: hypothetical protein IKU54_04050 [Oscillospiraceae bacterium]|nr:hypothetical protein [Oscillospiraceae bacterium]